MELAAGDGDIVENPTAADIVRAIDERGPDPYAADWSIVLDDEAGSFIEAEALADGRFDLLFVEKDRRLRATGALDAEGLKSIFLKFAAGDASWRDSLVWQTAQAAPSASAGSSVSREPPAWAVVAIIGSVALAFLMFSSGWRPFGEGAWFYACLIAFPFAAMIGMAVVVKLLEVRRAATWSRTAGRVVKSTVETRHRETDDGTTATNEPAIAYEFSVLGQKYRGVRIGIGEDTGGANTEATLARYPVGAVVTVYYDPRNPNDCVLERELPQGMGKGCAALVAIFALIIAVVAYISTGGYEFVASHIPDKSNAPFVMAITCFGAVTLLFFFAARRASSEASRWPAVSGTVLESGVETFHDTSDSSTRTSYRPAVEYSYRVNGREYRSRQIKLNVKTGGSETFARKAAQAYPVGKKVEVHYEPGNPGNAALENPTGMMWIILIAALACFAIAAWAAGFFS
jgi:hypothetical protein